MAIPFFFVVLIRFARALWRSLKDPEFQALFFLVVVTLVAGAMFYRLVEGWSLLDSFYFSVVTLTTIGYGDFTPSTTAGKIFTIFYIFAGLGIILGFINKVAERSVEQRGVVRGLLRRRSEGADSNGGED